MHQLHHFRLCPLSRSIRIVLGELDLEAQLIEEQPWQFRPELLSMNPAGSLPVLLLENGPCLCGTYAITEYLSDGMNHHPHDGSLLPLFPGNTEERAEIRRLTSWFNVKFDREITRELLLEKVYPRFSSGAGSAPDAAVLREVANRIRYHMRYIGFLVQSRPWIAGEEMSYADLAGAAHVSVIDYLGEIRWDEYPIVKDWYVRIKSRPSLRAILADRLPGITPPAHYDDLDF